MLDTSFACREKFHENELLTLYCNQCKVCICDKCRQTRHNHHAAVDVHQAAEQRKVDIDEMVQEMKKKIADYTENMERTKQSFRKSRERIASARSKVMTSVEDLMRLLQEHEKFMITRLDLSDSKVQREEAAQLQHFEICRSQLQTQVEWCEGILQKNDSVKILQAQDDLLRPSRGFRGAEKLCIYKPSHFRYEINKEHMETVRSVISAVGIVVESDTDPLQCVVERGMGLLRGEVGIGAIIKVKTKDSEGNLCYDEDDQVYVKVQSPAGKELSYRLTAPGKNGEYSLTYIPDCDGEHEVEIAVNGEPLSGSPWFVKVAPHHYKLLFSFGSYGTGQGQFERPCSIAIDEKSGKVAVADRERIQLFSLEGTYLTEISPIESTSVAFNKSGELIVIASNKILCFDESYHLVRNVSNKYLKQPGRLTIAGDGRLMVCDGGDKTLKVLSPDGSQLLLTISDPDRGTPFCPLHHQNMFFVSFPDFSILTIQSEFNIKVFSDDGVFLHQKYLGNCSGHIAIDRFNNLVVCAEDKQNLEILKLDGTLVNEIEEYSKRIHPFSVAVSGTGQLFVTDKCFNGVHVFQ